jgi:hypothetical protein
MEEGQRLVVGRLAGDASEEVEIVVLSGSATQAVVRAIEVAQGKCGVSGSSGKRCANPEVGAALLE